MIHPTFSHGCLLQLALACVRSAALVRSLPIASALAQAWLATLRAHASTLTGRMLRCLRLRP